MTLPLFAFGEPITPEFLGLAPLAIATLCYLVKPAWSGLAMTPLPGLT